MVMFQSIIEYYREKAILYIIVIIFFCIQIKEEKRFQPDSL